MENVLQTPKQQNQHSNKTVIIVITVLVIFFILSAIAVGSWVFFSTIQNASSQPNTVNPTATVNNTSTHSSPSLSPYTSPIPTEAITSLPTNPEESVQGSGNCVPGGCSGELCVDADAAQDTMSTCLYKEEYACYKEAICERQSDGTCGWTQTEESKKCLE